MIQEPQNISLQNETKTVKSLNWSVLGPDSSEFCFINFYTIWLLSICCLYFSTVGPLPAILLFQSASQPRVLTPSDGHWRSRHLFREYLRRCSRLLFSVWLWLAPSSEPRRFKTLKRFREQRHLRLWMNESRAEDIYIATIHFFQNLDKEYWIIGLISWSFRGLFPLVSLQFSRLWRVSKVKALNVSRSRNASLFHGRAVSAASRKIQRNKSGNIKQRCDD